MTRLTTRQKRWLVSGGKLLIVLLVLWGVWRTLSRAGAELEGFEWNVRPWWLVAAGGLYLVALLPSALFWHRVLRGLGQTPTLAQTLRAYYVGILGKYVPGKALVLVIRAGMLRRAGTTTSIVVVSIFIETLTLMAIGGLVAAAVLVIGYGRLDTLSLAAIGAALVIGLPTFPPVLRRLAAWTRSLRFEASALSQLDTLRTRYLLPGWLGIVAGWCLMGLSLWATAAALGGESDATNLDWPLAIVAAALGMVAGFVSFIPAGAIVREAVLLQLLSPALGEAGALVTAILLRVVWLVSEIVLSGILYIVPRIRGATSEAEKRHSQATPDMPGD